jgi:hypothetical protein
VLAKRAVVAWGLPSSSSGNVEVFLSITDEVGVSAAHPLGRFEGPCRDLGPAPAYRALRVAQCGDQQLHATAQRNDVVVYALKVPPGTTPDLMARRELLRVTVAVGAKIE